MTKDLLAKSAAFAQAFTDGGLFPVMEPVAAGSLATSASFGSGQFGVGETDVRVNMPRSVSQSAIRSGPLQNASGAASTPDSQASRITIGTGSRGSLAMGGVLSTPGRRSASGSCTD